jgi:hypothetical protein
MKTSALCLAMVALFSASVLSEPDNPHHTASPEEIAEWAPHRSGQGKKASKRDTPDKRHPADSHFFHSSGKGKSERDVPHHAPSPEEIADWAPHRGGQGKAKREMSDKPHHTGSPEQSADWHSRYGGQGKSKRDVHHTVSPEDIANWAPHRSGQGKMASKREVFDNGSNDSSDSLPTGYQDLGAAASGDQSAGTMLTGYETAGGQPSGTVQSGRGAGGVAPSGANPAGNMLSGSMPSGEKPSGDMGGSGERPSGMPSAMPPHWLKHRPGHGGDGLQGGDGQGGGGGVLASQGEGSEGSQKGQPSMGGQPSQRAAQGGTPSQQPTKRSIPKRSASNKPHYTGLRAPPAADGAGGGGI